MTLLNLTPWWWTRKEDQKAGSAPLKAYTFESAEQRATSFGDSFHSFVVPKTEKSSSQKNGGNHTKYSLGMAWHNMISA